MAVTTSITHLNPGDKAPAFKVYDQYGELFSPQDYKGKKVALFFYPNDDTETCTNEACNLRDNYALLQENGYEVIGISHERVESKKKFSDKYNLPFRLLADPGYEIAKLYGVYGDKKFMGRVITTIYRITFIIDEKDSIERIIHKVWAAKAAKQILDLS